MNNLENYFKKLCKEYQLIGANLIVANDKKIISQLSYGYADLETKKSMANDIILRIASVSKIIIALGIMKLVEEKKLSLNDDISDILNFPIRNPKYPDTPITVRMVTTQTSSITDGYDDEQDEIPQLGYNGVNGTTIECTLKDLLYNKNSKYYTPLTFSEYRPGTNWEYSNFGCGILGCIIEKITGKFYVDYINEILFKPLNIDASFKINNIKNFDNIGSLYNVNLRKRDGNYFLKYVYKFSPLGENYRGPAGGCFISNQDLAIIMQMLINKGTINNKVIFKEDTIELMYQMSWFGLSNDNYRAKGTQLRIYEKFDNLLLRGHTGNAYGVHSLLFFTLKHKLGISFIANGTYDPKFLSKREDFFYKLQKYIYDKLIIHKDFTIVIDNPNFISLKERKIILDSLLIQDNKNTFVPIINIADALEIIPSECCGIISINGDRIETFTFGQTEYVELEPLLKKLNIQYTKQDNTYHITKKTCS